MNVREQLFLNQDLKYRDFTKKLLPTVSEEKIIGVRIPVLRKFAKNLNDDNFDWYYFEEVMLHGLEIGYSNYEFDEKLRLLYQFIPRIDNWSVCDSVSSSLKFINKNKEDFLNYLQKYMNSEEEYEIRFVVVTLMNYYIEDEYIDFVIDYLTNIKSSYYYVNMAVAWALSVAFVKYEYKVMPIIKQKQLTKDVHNMLISKIRDSYRVDTSKKEILKKLKI